MAFVNDVKFTAGSSGTADFSDGTAVTGFRNLAGGPTSGQTYSYRAFSADLSQWENGQGVYTSGSPGTLARTTQYETSTGSKINFTTAPVVILTPLKSDLDAAVAVFTGDSGSGGVKGQVPAPGSGDAAAGKVLGAGGGWVGGPGLVLLASGTWSAQATGDINLSSYTGYRGIIIKLMSVVPATNASNLQMRVSSNGGTSYDAGSGNYAYAGLGLFSTATGANTSSDSATQIQLTTGINNTNGGNLTVEILDHNNSGVMPKIKYDAVFEDGGGVHATIMTGAAIRAAAQITNAVRFFMSSGNIASGKYAVYGLN